MEGSSVVMGPSLACACLWEGEKAVHALVPSLSCLPALLQQLGRLGDLISLCSLSLSQWTDTFLPATTTFLLPALPFYTHTSPATFFLFLYTCLLVPTTPPTWMILLFFFLLFIFLFILCHVWDTAFFSAFLAKIYRKRKAGAILEPLHSLSVFVVQSISSSLIMWVDSLCVACVPLYNSDESLCHHVLCEWSPKT